MKPIIGIAGSDQQLTEPDAHWIAYTPRSFVEGIQQAGGLPFILPVGNPQDAAEYVARIDKLLLAGGHDVAPVFYHQLPHQKLGAVYPLRDRFELALIQEAVNQKKPILGICRGMQVLNVAFGGTLYQDLSLKEGTIKHVQAPTPFHIPTHPVRIEATSQLAKIVGTDYQVNSFHHQMIDHLADEFRIIATAPDGVVEGIESKHQKIMGLQWHPELTRTTIASEQKIIEFFVSDY
ncbi:gamma-glutamyl-gamma-aminobutyrate hydrolase family protein [Enterococcus songbeiensis]|uniref:gamma-glutamyl-gamma-aminobutyrate hydrolase family protein n=1 Tax=Enterococcus songbeiensis TaxID=2559927 RepID=UPI0010FA2BA9|nr:gamma-glutamyl-gamma-aminobutyrate hydrolase family protein [Enterococcus songbeiensis]